MKTWYKDKQIGPWYFSMSLALPFVIGFNIGISKPSSWISVDLGILTFGIDYDK